MYLWVWPTKCGSHGVYVCSSLCGSWACEKSVGRGGLGRGNTCNNPIVFLCSTHSAWITSSVFIHGSILTFCFTGPQKISLTPNCWREICKGLNDWAVEDPREILNYRVPEMHFPAFWHERLQTIVCESFPHHITQAYFITLVKVKWRKHFPCTLIFLSLAWSKALKYFHW